MDNKVLILYMTDSPVRSVVQDISEETFELTVRGPEGPAFSFSYSGAPVGREAAMAGNLAVVPTNLDPAFRKQIIDLPVYTPTRQVKRFVRVSVSRPDICASLYRVRMSFHESVYLSHVFVCSCVGSGPAAAGLGGLQDGAGEGGFGEKGGGEGGGGGRRLAAAAFSGQGGWTFLPPGEDNLNNGCLRGGCTGSLTDANLCSLCGRQYEFVQNKGWRYKDPLVRVFFCLCLCSWMFMYYFLLCVCISAWLSLMLNLY
jgi:hypothetical protein